MSNTATYYMLYYDFNPYNAVSCTSKSMSLTLSLSRSLTHSLIVGEIHHQNWVYVYGYSAQEY